MKNLIKEAAIIAVAILGFGCLFHSAIVFSVHFVENAVASATAFAGFAP